MKFTYFDEKDSRGLINNMFSLNFSQKSLPFKSSIIPIGLPSIIYAFGEKQEVFYKQKKIDFKGLLVSSQFDSTYDYIVNTLGSKNIGVNLHPTALYKILGTDINHLTNNFTCLSTINNELHDRLYPIFIKNKDNIKNFILELKSDIENLKLTIDDDVNKIDIAVNYIIEKEGMLQIVDLLKIIPLSQKSLEIKFKKIIGLTPGKYTRLIRFIKLMRKYENKKIDINDLIYMYNYYDHSHFIRDFKLFMPESPKEYFKKEYPLIKAYSKDL